MSRGMENEKIALGSAMIQNILARPVSALRLLHLDNHSQSSLVTVRYSGCNSKRSARLAGGGS